MGWTLVIAEPGMTWDRDLTKAFKLIDAAKEADADVCKFQWTSSGAKLQARRKVDPKYRGIYERGVQYPEGWLHSLKAHCDDVGIEFACTTYLPEDVAVVTPLVKRYKISAYESDYTEHVTEHLGKGKPVVISCNTKRNHAALFDAKFNAKTEISLLYCVSQYPTQLESLKLSTLADFGNVYGNSPIMYRIWDGLSDHTANVLTGAAAVAAGARIVEAHIRLMDTDKSNPDYGHSLEVDWSCMTPECGHDHLPPFKKYVQNIRTVERML